MAEELPSLDDIRAAAERIAPFIHRTPVMTSRTFDGLAGRKLFFKCEHLQRIGAFKIRGATNAVQQLSAETAARGVVTHSSGNHAQAVALAARTRGIPAFIVMPKTAPAVKRRAVEGYGGKVIECETALDDRERKVQSVIAETGATLVHPYNDPFVIAGQGTAALELLADVPDLDAIVVPISGGGLISGIALAAKGINPRIQIFGAEPAGADDAARSKAKGEIVVDPGAKSIADGLLANLGSNTWPCVRDLVEDVVVVSEEEIVAAMRLMFERMKQVVEPSGATSVAAALSAKFRALPNLERAGILLSGGNVNLDRLPWK